MSVAQFASNVQSIFTDTVEQARDNVALIGHGSSRYDNVWFVIDNNRYEIDIHTSYWFGEIETVFSFGVYSGIMPYQFLNSVSQDELDSFMDLFFQGISEQYGVIV